VTANEGKMTGTGRMTAPRKEKEKRAACVGKRPKSREETPKEGSDSARRYRTATICDRAAQKARAFESFPVQNSSRPVIGQKFNADVFLTLFQILGDRLSNRSAVALHRYHQALEFVIDEPVKKCTVSQADSQLKNTGF
jgi:hypothetical protein